MAAEGGGTVIVGGGPAGLLLAHLLLAQPRPELLPVRVFESRQDPCIPVPVYKTRQYAVGIGARGRDAISRVERLWEAVEPGGVPTSQFVIHTGSKSIPLKRNPGKPSLLINQRSLAAILISELRSRYPKDTFEVNFQEKCIHASFQDHTVTFNGKYQQHTVPYNILVGADGVRSTVREEFIRQRGFDYQQINMPYTFKVLHVARPPELSPNAVHTFRRSLKNNNEKQSWIPFSSFLSLFSRRDGSSVRYGCFPAPDDGMSVLIEWMPESQPEELLQITSAPEFKFFVEKYMSPLKVSIEAAEAFLEQRPTSSMRVKCNRFFDSEGRAVLIGDAAHAMSNALGQGCNSSLQDSVALSQALIQESNDMILALEKYSNQQVREDHAAAYLSEHSFPQATWLLPFYFFGNLASAVLSKALPQSIVKPSIQSLCSETLTPYSEVVEMHRFWLSFVELTNNLARVNGPSS